MRAALALLATLLLLPSATAIGLPGTALPVTVRTDTTLPGEDGCADCAGADARVAVSIPNCYDCPAVGVFAGAETEGGRDTTATVRACYSAFFGFCFVDETIRP